MDREIDELEVARLAAKTGADTFAKFRENGSIGIHSKSFAHDLVTDADIASERAIVAIIKKHFPDDEILSEEEYSSTDVSALERFWCLDPIDGTVNYAHGQLHVASSVALIDQGEVVAGAVNAPFLNEEYWAAKDKGAFCNGEKIRPSGAATLGDSLIATGFPYDRSGVPPILAQVERVLGASRGIRRLGACAIDMCWVACGRLDGYFETVAPWDMAASGLICREAGATVGQFQEHPEETLPQQLRCKDLLVTTPKIFKELEALLNAA